MMDTSSDPLLPQVHGPIPRDRFSVVYFIFYLLGLGSLSPWNFFITASEYFKYKFRNTTLPVDCDYLNPKYQTELESMFEGYLTVASTVPNVLFNFFTALLVKRISIKTRMISSMSITLVMFIATAVLVKVNTDKWQTHFFVITMLTAVIVNSTSAVFGASSLGLASRFPARYMQAVMTGQAMGGIFAAVANIITLAAGTSVVNSGLGFFIAATLTSVFSLIGYGLLYYLNFSRYYIVEIGNTLGVEVNSEESSGDVVSHHSCSYYLSILKLVWSQGLCVCIVFFVTLSCFPAIASSIVSVDKGSNDWTEKFFSAFVCFLIFNAGDWSGRSIAGSIQIPSYQRPNCLLILCICRVVFIPLLMLCNAQPRTDAVVFDSDIYPVVFILLLGLTNGHFSTLSMMYGSSRVTEEYAESTGAILSFCLTLGLLFGSLFSLLLMKSL